MTTTAALNPGAANALRLGRRVRNHRLVDTWSAAHVAWGLVLALVVGPYWAIVLLVAWEPFEIFLLGPLLARWGVPFGHETWRNSLSDIVFDVAGATVSLLWVLPFWDPFGVW